MGAGETHEVPYDEKVTGETELTDRAEFVADLLSVLWADFFEACFETGDDAVSEGFVLGFVAQELVGFGITKTGKAVAEVFE